MRTRIVVFLCGRDTGVVVGSGLNSILEWIRPNPFLEFLANTVRLANIAALHEMRRTRIADERLP